MKSRTSFLLLSFCLASLCLFPAFDLWDNLYSAIFSIWRNSEGDAIFVMGLFSSLAEGEWFPFGEIVSSRLAFPNGFSMMDFPLADSFHFLICKVISLFISDPVAIYNIYWLIGYPLAATSMSALLLEIGIKKWLIFPLSLCFAFLPFHFNRYSHLFLASYWQIPLFVLVLFHIIQKKWDLNISSKNLITTLPYSIFLVLFGASGLYYAFFGCFFLVILSLYGYLEERSFRIPKICSIAIILITLGTAMDVAPNVIHSMKAGKLPAAAKRQPVEAEIYAFKLTPYLLPSPLHRLPLMQKIRSKYTSYQSGAANEAAGLVTAIGTILLLGLSLLNFWQRHSQKRDLLLVASLTFSGFLLATHGGIGALFNALVFPTIRCYERIYPYISCFSLVAFAIILHHLIKNRIKSTALKWLLSGVFCALIIFEQSSPAYYFNKNQSSAVEERNFFAKISSFPHQDGAILQLPYINFPEEIFEKLTSYSHLRGTIFSTKLKWSHGAFNNQPAAAELRRICGSPLDLNAIRKKGYYGIYVDTNGYKDNGRAIQLELERKTSRPPIVSERGRFLYFNLQNQ